MGNLFFSFQISASFPDSLLLLISNLIPLWSENTLNSFKLETYFMAQNMSNIDSIYLNIHRICILLSLDVMFCKCQLGQVDQQCYISLLYPYWFLYLFYQLFIERPWNLYDCRFVCLLIFEFYWFLFKFLEVLHLGR